MHHLWSINKSQQMNNEKSRYPGQSLKWCEKHAGGHVMVFQFEWALTLEEHVRAGQKGLWGLVQETG